MGGAQKVDTLCFLIIFIVFYPERRRAASPPPRLTPWRLTRGFLRTSPLQEIIINNHKPKSFSSSVEHPHKDSAWFTKSQKSQCEAAPHSVT